MPYRAKTPCNKPGCPHLRPCPVHKVVRTKDTRPSPSVRGYDSNWKIIRATFIKRYPMCSVCGDVAKEVDHIIPLRDGGTHQWSNLQSLCKSCHSNKTNRFDGGFGNKKGYA